LEIIATSQQPKPHFYLHPSSAGKNLVLFAYTSLLSISLSYDFKKQDYCACVHLKWKKKLKRRKGIICESLFTFIFGRPDCQWTLSIYLSHPQTKQFANEM
jgi:hypothetical protein